MQEGGEASSPRMPRAGGSAAEAAATKTTADRALTRQSNYGEGWLGVGSGEVPGYPSSNLHCSWR